MKKRILSVLLAALMSMSALAACDNGGEPVDDVENSDGQQVVQGDIPEDPKPEDSKPEDPIEWISDANTVVLNMDLNSVKEPLEVETPEKVLKLTAKSEGDADSKQLIFSLPEEIIVPAGSTLEYDVYLETAAVGMGVFDMRLGSQYISALTLDAAGITNYVTTNLSSAAYGRWYHRFFDLQNSEAQSSKMFRFSVGGLTNGGTNVCYFDNICIKDSNGNVIYTFDEEFISNYELRQSGDIFCDFEIVDDPAPSVAKLSAEEIPNIYSNMGVVGQADSFKATFTLNDVLAGPALYVGELDPSSSWGVRGLVLIAESGRLTLYRIDDTIQELASKVILGMDKGSEVGLQIDVYDGDIVRGYWLDDMEGIEPWPEFELRVEDCTGKSVGAMDLYGRDTVLNSVTVGGCRKVTSEETYVNSVKDDLADPDVLYYDGVYYLYGTMGPGYQVFSSTDLVNWEHRGQCLDHPGACWAPDVEYYNGKFYMACTIDRTLVIAVADSPLGPFTVDPEPIMGFITFDGHFFVDDDGQAYIYYSTDYEGRPYGIYGAKFDFETRKMDYSSEVCCFVPEFDWETYGKGGSVGGNEVVEGAYMVKHNGLYYMTYSGGDYQYKGYAVGYAVSESPLGPFEKYEGNPIHLGNTTIHGTAHHCFTTTPDGELIIVYHKHKTLTEVEVRRICVDKARFAPTESGIDRLETYGPTTTPQPMPLG